MLEGHLLPGPHKPSSSLHITLGCAHPHKLQRQPGAFCYTPQVRTNSIPSQRWAITTGSASTKSPSASSPKTPCPSVGLPFLAVRSLKFFPCISWGLITSSPGLPPPIVTAVQGMHTACPMHTARHSKEQLTCLKQLTGAALKPCSCKYFPQSKPRTSAINRQDSRKSVEITEKTQST